MGALKEPLHPRRETGECENRPASTCAIAAPTAVAVGDDVRGPSQLDITRKRC